MAASPMTGLAAARHWFCRTRLVPARLGKSRVATPCLLAAVLLAGAGPLYADVVRGEMRPLRQPDGTRVWVRIWGDEFYTVVESLDGYTLIRDPATGVICYADLSPDGRGLVSTGIALADGAPAHLRGAPHLRIDAQAARGQVLAARTAFEVRRWEGRPGELRDGPLAGPTTGVVQGICLIVDFSDDVGTIPPLNVHNYCNQSGYTGYGNNGSVYDYFRGVSDGALNYTNYVPNAYYRAAHPKSYYTDPGIPYGQRARELILEALNDLNNHGLDFSQYDADHNGTVDALNCYYAGYSESAWASGLWPHAYSVYFCADGVCTDGYQMSDMGDSLALSTFCHENGHMLCGFPDLYDYNYDSTGVGQFCIMAYGTSGTNPCEPCAYMKYIAGWASTTVLTTPQAGLVAPSTSNTIYKYNHPTRSNEYYLIENRQRSGRDVGLPDAGLAIWHIDTNGNNSNNQMTPSQHYLVTLVQADGRWDLEHNANYGDGTDLWAAPTYARCTPVSAPNTNWWDGSASGLWVMAISNSAATMTFTFDVGTDCNHNNVPDPREIAAGTSPDCNANGVIDACDIAAGTSADCDGNGVPDECDLAAGDCNANGVVDACENPAHAGLVAQYYDGLNFAGSRRSVIQGPIDFDWGSGEPWPGFGANTFSVRWQGYIRCPGYSGSYTFYTITDDGVRLWVNGVQLINKWVNQTATEWSGAITLQADADYPMVMEYYDNTGNASAQLDWRPPGQAREVLPVSRMLPAYDCNSNGVPDPCDLAAHTSTDVNGSGIPDECEHLGDMNCDGALDFDDINPFVTALVSQQTYENNYPECQWLHADCTGEGVVNFDDINPFVRLLAGP